MTDDLPFNNYLLERYLYDWWYFYCAEKLGGIYYSMEILLSGERSVALLSSYHSLVVRSGKSDDEDIWDKENGTYWA